MKLADSNIWLAVALSGHEHNHVVSEWFREQTDIAFCRQTQLSLVRLLTTRAVLAPYGNLALTNEQAWQLYDGLRADPRIGFAAEPPDLETHWKRLAAVPAPAPKVWMDAYLAAFAIAGDHQLVTIDAAFTHFPGLDLVLLSNS